MNKSAFCRYMTGRTLLFFAGCCILMMYTGVFCRADQVQAGETNSYSDHISSTESIIRYIRQSRASARDMSCKETGRTIRLTQDVMQGSIEPDRFEPNDTFDDATDLGIVSASDAFTGLTIHDAEDVDYYYFQMDGETPPEFILLDFDNDLGELVISMYDEDQELVALGTNAPNGQFVQLIMLEDDEYYLRVQGLEGETNYYSLLFVDMDDYLAWLEDEENQYSEYHPLAAPDWQILLSSYGYADLLLDWTPGLMGREYLSGEWGAAVSYELSDSGSVPAVWLEPYFEYPDWETNSDFEIITEFNYIDEDDTRAYSVIANDHLEIRQDYTIVDTLFGIPIGLTPASQTEPDNYMHSNRYVLQHTYTIKNVSGETITDLNLYQLLHGLESQYAVYDDRQYPGPFSEYRYSTVQIGSSEFFDFEWDDWDSWDNDMFTLLEDYIVMASDIEPASFENSHYGIESIDSHSVGKPSVGAHISIENGILNNQDYFAPDELWIGSAMQWDLGALNSQQEVSLTLLLTILTGTVVTNDNPQGMANGGAHNVGGLDFLFSGISEEGSLFALYISADEDEMLERINAGQFGPADFPGGSEDYVQAWNITFSGSFSDSMTVSFGYDPALIPAGIDENNLALYYWNGSEWEHLPSMVDTEMNTVTTIISSLSWFGLGYYTPDDDAPIADFSAHKTNVEVGETVQFTDMSTGIIDSWAWDFGDGQNSEVQHPEYSYSESGEYTVALTVTGPGGMDTKIKSQYITVSEEAVFAGGDGSSDDPYLVANAIQLYRVREYLNAYFQQVADIDLIGYTAGEGWDPLGNASAPFTGHYDGNGYHITNLVIESPPFTDNVGLFGYVSAIGIENVSIIDANISGTNQIGGLIGNLQNGTIKNCHVSGTITGNNNLGGLAGISDAGIINASSFNGNIRGQSDVGGLVGENSDAAFIQNSIAHIDIEARSYSGGLVGKNKNFITDSYATGYLKADGWKNGGLAGENQGFIMSCFSTVNVSALEDGDLEEAGGLVGNNHSNGTIINCYASGNVSGAFYIGGLAGENRGDISYCYAAGMVEGENTGGLVGDKRGTVNNSYYNYETTGQDDTGNGEPLSTDAMKSELSFTNWDFEDIWGIVEGKTYPYLQWIMSDNEYHSVVESYDLITSQWVNIPFELSVTFRNTGTRTWDIDDMVYLGAVGDHDDLAPSVYWRIGMNENIVPGQLHTFTIPMKSAEAGYYFTEWQMLKEGRFWFGENFRKKIEVVQRTDVDHLIWQLFQ